MSQLTAKDMSVLREGASARAQWKQNSAAIKDYGLNHDIRMQWGYKEAKRDLRPFVLKIDDRSYTLAWGELIDMDRGGFFRREEGNPSQYTLRWLDGPQITIDTDLNEEAKRDYIVRLTADGVEAYLDWYEVLRSGRFI
jgi:hypothetical protein